jgi:hypothetical protein
LQVSEKICDGDFPASRFWAWAAAAAPETATPITHCATLPNFGTVTLHYSRP